MEIRIQRVQVGVNEEGAPIMAPANQPPQNYTAVEITATEYVYQVPDREGE